MPMFQKTNPVYSRLNLFYRRNVHKKRNKKDKIFRKIFSNPTLFLNFLQDYIAQDWVKDLTIQDIEYLPREFPSFFTTDRESDVLVKIKHPQFNNDLYLIILLEHQSKVHHLMAYRIFEYMALIWREGLSHMPLSETLQKDFKLPFILPIVYYDGEGDWIAETSFQNKVAFQEFFKDYVPHFKYEVVSLKKISLEKLEECHNALSLILWLDKCRSMNDLEILTLKKEYWQKIKKALEDSGVLKLTAEAMQAFLERLGVEEDTILELVENLNEGRHEEMFEHCMSDYHKEKEMWVQKEMSWNQKEMSWNQEKISLNQKLKQRLQKSLTLLFSQKFQVPSNHIMFFLKECNEEILSQLLDEESSFKNVDDLKNYVKKFHP